MPIFEYKCTACNHTEDVLQKSSRATKQTCPKCKKPMKKQMSSFAVGINHDGSSSKCISCTDRGCPHANN